MDSYQKPEAEHVTPVVPYKEVEVLSPAKVTGNFLAQDYVLSQSSNENDRVVAIDSSSVLELIPN